MERTVNPEGNIKGKYYITCKISNYQSCSESIIPFFSYIEYKILFKTNKKTWEIKKRYKHFDELHKKLSKKIKNLPKLPHKTIFKSQVIIDDRKIKLQKYLFNLLRRDDVYDHDLIFDFIELKKEEYLLMKNNLDDGNNNELSPVSSFTKNQTFVFLPSRNMFNLKAPKDQIIVKDDFFYSNSEIKDENNINEAKIKLLISKFLEQLDSKKKEMSIIIKKFEEKILYDKNLSVNLKSEDIYRLFFGDKTIKIKGLLFHCGDVKTNILGAELCLEFLTKLLNYEYNLNSELFIDILKLGKLENFSQINFPFHFNSGKPIIFASCCRLLKIIVNPEKRIDLKKLLIEESLIDKVKNFFIFSDKN